MQPRHALLFTTAKRGISGAHMYRAVLTGRKAKFPPNDSVYTKFRIPSVTSPYTYGSPHAKFRYANESVVKTGYMAAYPPPQQSVEAWLNIVRPRQKLACVQASLVVYQNAHANGFKRNWLSA